MADPNPAEWYAPVRRPWEALKAGWRTLLLVGAVGAAAGWARALLMQPTYESVAVFQPPLSLPLQIDAVSSTATFFSDLLTSDTMLTRVSRRTLRWRGGPVNVQRLRRAIRVDANLRTAVIRFTVAAPAPDLAKALADTLLAVLNDVSLAEARQQDTRRSGPLTVLSQPAVPDRPSRPRPRVALVAGLLIGLCLAVGKLLLTG
jgi:capsular polysaccharide biosynthesis protein